MSFTSQVQTTIDNIKQTDKESLAMSLDNTHAPGLFSLVVCNDPQPGHISRIFIANKEIKPLDIQFHTHRYHLNLTALSGKIKHHTADENNMDGSFWIPKYKYKSPITGGNGLVFLEDIKISCDEYTLPTLSQVQLNFKDIHTVSCSKDSVWAVLERGFQSPHSYFYGVPFDGAPLYEKAKPYKIKDMQDKVIAILENHLKNINQYSTREKTNENNQ